MKVRLRFLYGALIPAVLLLAGCSSAPEGGESSLSSLFVAAGTNTIIGMGTVFAVLVFLTWVISLFKYFPRMAEKLNSRKKEAAEKTAAPRKKPRPQPPAATPPQEIRRHGSAPAGAAAQEELMAVIAAAVAAYEEDMQREKSAAQPSGRQAYQAPVLQNGIHIQSYRRQAGKGGKQ